MQANILRLHVENEGVGQRLFLASGNSSLELNGGQVAEDGGVCWSLRAKLLGSHELATDEGNLNGLVFIVGDINDSLSRSAVDQLDAEDVGLGERGNDLSIQLRFRSVGDGLIISNRGLDRYTTVISPCYHICHHLCCLEEIDARVGGLDCEEGPQTYNISLLSKDRDDAKRKSCEDRVADSNHCGDTRDGTKERTRRMTMARSINGERRSRRCVERSN